LVLLSVTAAFTFLLAKRMYLYQAIVFLAYISMTYDLS
jgi:hypothetical protein